MPKVPEQVKEQNPAVIALEIAILGAACLKIKKEYYRRYFEADDKTLIPPISEMVEKGTAVFLTSYKNGIFTVGSVINRDKEPDDNGAVENDVVGVNGSETLKDGESAVEVVGFSSPDIKLLNRTLKALQVLHDRYISQDKA